MTPRSISTDLLTPLGAYLRLREAGQRELPARVGRAGPARPLLVHRLRLAARLASRRPSAAASRSSATSPTTTSRSSSRPCRCPTTGRGLPESRFVVADTLVRFDHGAAWPRCSPATPRPWRASLAGELVFQEHKVAAGGRARASGARPDRATLRGRRAARARSTSAPATPSRSCSRSGPSGRRRLRARALPRAAARQPVAVPLPARARRPRARRLLAGDARQVRGRAAPASTRSRARPSRARATPSGCSRPRRTAPST